MIFGFIVTTELLLISGLALLLVGGKKLPEMMRGLGKGVREFKEGMNRESPNEPDANGNPGDSASDREKQTAGIENSPESEC